MHFNIPTILSNTILQGPVSSDLQAKYKDKLKMDTDSNQPLGIKTNENFIRLESESDLEKTLDFINQFNPVPQDIPEIIANLENITTKPNKLDLIKTGQTDFIIQFLDNSSSVKNPNSLNTIPILYSTDKILAEKLKVPFPGFVGFNSQEMSMYRVPLISNNKTNTMDSIINYISLPVLGLVNHENIMKYESVEIPIFYMLIEKNKKEEILNEFKSISNELRNEGKIGLIEYNEGAPAHKSMATKEQLPTAVIQVSGEKVFLHNVNPKSFKNFFLDYQKGKLEPPIKEEPIDNTNKVVKIAVRKNADELIKNKEKDILVVFYAHWCGFCKTLMPELEIIGEKLKSQKTVEIVKVDLALNHLPQYKVSHYPFIRLYKAKTNEEVDFKGNRNIEEILKFVKENSHFKVNLPDLDFKVGEEKVDL